MRHLLIGLACALALIAVAGCATRAGMASNDSTVKAAPAPMNTPAPAMESPGATSTAVPTQSAMKIDKSRLPRAPELISSTWINSNPLAANDLRGKVVIVSFWTFACYNCQNTLPYFKAWDASYRDQGLVIIGVHTPELSFERDVANVRKAVQDDGLHYPIAVDGDYSNWNRYHVAAWPTWFIVDKEGYIRYSHVGEGDYDGSEKMIRRLLAE